MNHHTEHINSELNRLLDECMNSDVYLNQVSKMFNDIQEYDVFDEYFPVDDFIILYRYLNANFHYLIEENQLKLMLSILKITTRYLDELIKFDVNLDEDDPLNEFTSIAIDIMTESGDKIENELKNRVVIS